MVGVGGGSRGRTGDIQLAKLALCQLSYAPAWAHFYSPEGDQPVVAFTLLIVTNLWSPFTLLLRPLCGRNNNNAALARPLNLSVQKGYGIKHSSCQHCGCMLPCPNTPKGISPSSSASLRRLLLRKEVIQPLVPQRLPCYDFIPITTHTLDGSLHCWLVHRIRVQTAFMM